MAEVEEAIVDKLMNDVTVTNLIGTRLYPQVVPQDVARPSVAYQKIDSVPVATRSIAMLARTTIQFTCEADDYAGAKEVAAALRASLSGWHDEYSDPMVFGVVEANESDGYSEQHLAPVVRVDVSVWHAIDNN